MIPIFNDSCLILRSKNNGCNLYFINVCSAYRVVKMRLERGWQDVQSQSTVSELALSLKSRVSKSPFARLCPANPTAELIFTTLPANIDLAPVVDCHRFSSHSYDVFQSAVVPVYW